MQEDDGGARTSGRVMNCGAIDVRVARCKLFGGSLGTRGQRGEECREANGVNNSNKWKSRCHANTPACQGNAQVRQKQPGRSSQLVGLQDCFCQADVVFCCRWGIITIDV